MERFNQTLQGILDKNLDKQADHVECEKYIYMAVWEYNTSVHSVTSEKPYEQMLQCKPRMDILRGNGIVNKSGRLHSIQFAKEVTDEIGAKVLVMLHPRTNKDQGWYKKQAPRWKKGYVVEDIGHNNYQ